MKNFAIVLGLLASVSSFAGVSYSNTVDLPSSARGFKIWRAQIFQLATRTEIRQIPGCNPNGERHPVECQEEVALEREPVLMVDVSYTDIFSQGEGNEKSFATLHLDPADAGKKLSLKVVKAERTIQVVDVRNSKLCPVLESGDTYPGCVENIVYKPAKTIVNELTVIAE